MEKLGGTMQFKVNFTRKLRKCEFCGMNYRKNSITNDCPRKCAHSLVIKLNIKCHKCSSRNFTPLYNDNDNLVAWMCNNCGLAQPKNFKGLGGGANVREKGNIYKR